MLEPVALVIVYNHKYDENIDILEKIYQGRFSNIFHLVPFYEGDKPNVIAVYEQAYYFQGYLAQGFKQYFREEYQHYLFIADDLLLNPVINEKNYKTYFHLSQTDSFISRLSYISDIYTRPWTEKVCWYSPDNKERVIQAKNELPDFSEAMRRFDKHNLKVTPLDFKKICLQMIRQLSPQQAYSLMARFLSILICYLVSKMSRKRKTAFNSFYPLIRSYSDIAIVSGKNIEKFCHYCGVFAAQRLFVDVALPTALVLSTEEIVVENDLELSGKAIWTPEDGLELERYNKQLKNLLSAFPKDYLYLHPIKLSQWNKER